MSQSQLSLQILPPVVVVLLNLIPSMTLLRSYTQDPVLGVLAYESEDSSSSFRLSTALTKGDFRISSSDTSEPEENVSEELSLTVTSEGGPSELEPPSSNGLHLGTERDASDVSLITRVD